MAIDDLPAGGVIRYGSFTFNDAVTTTTGCQIRPQLDQAQRTITHCVYELSLKTYVTGNPTDANVQAAVEQLTQAGLPFRYAGHGCSNLRISVDGDRRKDVLFGPFPRLVALKPIGAKRVCEILWEVTVSIPVGESAAYSGYPMEFNFKVTFKIGPNGDTTRITQGHLRIPNGLIKPGGRSIRDTPDRYREDVVPPLLPGFRRTSQDFENDESKTYLRFSVVDEELPPNLPPPGVTLCTASHTFDSEGLAKWTGTLEAEYELVRGTPAEAAVGPFLGLLDFRVQLAKLMITGDGLDAGVALPAGARPAGWHAAVVPIKFSVSEPTIYGPGNTRVRMSCSYLVAGVGLSAILGKSGLWTPAFAGTWAQWAASVALPLGPRGTANLRLNPNDDAVVNLNNLVPPVVPAAPAPRPK